MTMVTIENTADSATYLPTNPKEAKFVVVPRAVKSKVRDDKTGDEKVVVAPGKASIDSDVLAKLKDHKVVSVYFSSGRLRVAAGNSGPPPTAPPPQGKGEK